MRLIALGASNLSRGLRSVVAAARGQWGSGTEVLAALGHGRSYGASSRFLVRGLPGILDSGLWRALHEGAGTPAQAFVTDVGNDILYGHPPERILDWVTEAVDRLERAGARVTVAGLPVAGLEGLSSARFVFFRSLFVPNCRLSLAEAAARAGLVQDALANLARGRSLRFVPLRPEWYGADPIHIRPARAAEAWREILGLAPDASTPGPGQVVAPPLEAVRLLLAAPQRMSLLGVDWTRAQPCYHAGIQLSLY